MQPQAAGEQAVAKGDLDDVVAGDAAGGDDAGHEIGPVFNVLFGIGAHRGLARGARRGVDADDVLHGNSQHAEGVVVPDVILGGEGDVLHIRQDLDLVPAGDARRPQALVVKGHVIVAVIHHAAQALQLERFDIRAPHGLDVFLEKPCFHGLANLLSQQARPGPPAHFAFVDGALNQKSSLSSFYRKSAGFAIVFRHASIFSPSQGRWHSNLGPKR